MITLINYASDNMTISQQKNKISALKHGVDQVVCYNRSHIPHDFYRMNKDILDQERGAGYWLWKPLMIYQTMLDLPDGDILIYSDSGIEFINNVNHIADGMGDCFFFTNGFKHVEWCKLIAFKTICPDHRYGVHIDQPTQIQASLLFFRVNQRTKDFVKEWLLFCQFPGFIDDSVSEMPNWPTFAENRHDQAILTCCAIKHDINYNNLWCDKVWENQRFRWPHSTYPPILIHHRKRNSEW